MSSKILSQRIPLLAGVLSVSLLAACATELTEDQQFAREYERVERHESIREFMSSCEYAGHVVLYTGPTYQKLRDPVKHIPSNARRSDYVCASQRSISRAFQAGG